MAPASQYFLNIQFFPVVFKQVNTFTNCLEYTELDSVMDKLGEMASPRWAGMNVSSWRIKLNQYWFDSGYWFFITSGHEASAMASAFHTTTCSEVNKVNTLFRQPSMAAY
jgi:hypothetical protein